MRTHRIITLGCKVNQCESAALGHLLEASGSRCSRGNESPDVIVVNTCAVTGRAAMQSRQAIRRALRSHPCARVIVTGCYAQTAAHEVRAIEGVDCIVGQARKMGIADWIARPPAAGSQVPEDRPAEPERTFTAFAACDSRERTRAFLKIQDGCNTRCTYCIVPYARGRSRSMPAADVRTHLARLGAAGVREVVLTGIHLGAYGTDLIPATTLTELLSATVGALPVDRIRLSSIEPTEIEGPLIALAAAPGSPLCPHFHIPLQSGDDHVLRRMGRPYTSAQFARTIEEVHRHLPQAAIGLDVMAGFPGESDAAFLNTCRLVEDLPVSYLHVFPFSPRRGTPAAAFKDKVPASVATERCRILRRLGAEKRAAFHGRMVGRSLMVLIERAAQDGSARGLSDNYVPVVVEKSSVRHNTLVPVRIERITDEGQVVGQAG